VARILLRLAIAARGGWLAATPAPGLIRVASVAGAVHCSLVLGLLNALVRPVLLIRTLPLALFACFDVAGPRPGD
jgi:uncharacterized membrane protein YvlD (DUF360 family)